MGDIADRRRGVAAAASLSVIAGLLAACSDGPSAPAPVYLRGAAPAAANGPPPPPWRENRIVTVRHGETVGDIAHGYHVPERSLIAVNNLKPPYRLHVGDRLVLPDRGAPPVQQAMTPPPQRRARDRHPGARGPDGRCSGAPRAAAAGPAADGCRFAAPDNAGSDRDRRAADAAGATDAIAARRSTATRRLSGSAGRAHAPTPLQPRDQRRPPPSRRHRRQAVLPDIVPQTRRAKPVASAEPAPPVNPSETAAGDAGAQPARPCRCPASRCRASPWTRPARRFPLAGARPRCRRLRHRRTAGSITTASISPRPPARRSRRR